MQLDTRPLVVAICGPSGVGKSTLIQAIQSRLAGATALALDEYETVSMFPETVEWLASGADLNRFQTPDFIADLRALIAGQPITLPAQQGSRQPAPLVLVEEPFGRERDLVAPLLDAVVYVSVPLTIALARKLLRRNAFFPWEAEPAHHLSQLQRYLTWYLQTGHALALALVKRERATADLVVDGERPTEDSVTQIIDWLARVR